MTEWRPTGRRWRQWAPDGLMQWAFARLAQHERDEQLVARFERAEANRGPIPTVPFPVGETGEPVEIPRGFRFRCPRDFAALDVGYRQAISHINGGLPVAAAVGHTWVQPEPPLEIITVFDLGWMAPGEDEQDFFLVSTVLRNDFVALEKQQGRRVGRLPQRLMVDGERAIWYESDFHHPWSDLPSAPPAQIVIRTVLALARRHLWSINVVTLNDRYTDLHQPFWTVVGSIEWQ
jgi:hypothetical protein